MNRINVNFCGVEFKNPVIPASGTFGYGREYEQFYPLSKLGGISVKGTTLHRREGNPGPRVAETPSGMLNSVGLQNGGVDKFINYELPNLVTKDTRIIANIAGSTIEECAELAEKLNGTAVDMIELNISCPNVKEGGIAFGQVPASAERITKAVKKVAKQPVIMKLRPNVTDITVMAKAAEAGGADGISLINTLTGMKIDIHRRTFALANRTGGMSGPAVHPVAVRMVYETAHAVNIPIIGMGGITNASDAIEMILAGATAVSVGTANFVNPKTTEQIVDGIAEYMDKYGVKDISELVGAVDR